MVRRFWTTTENRKNGTWAEGWREDALEVAEPACRGGRIRIEVYLATRDVERAGIACKESLEGVEGDGNVSL